MGSVQPEISSRRSSSINGNLSKNPRPVWQDISPRFTDPRECLVSYLALEAAEVIAGAKPANLISINNRRRTCGRNPYELWRKWGTTVLVGTGLSVYELSDRGDAVLLLLYSPLAINELLRRPSVAAVLNKAGYKDVSSSELVLDELATRVCRGSFPHEIGVFLGYPLKDVAAFMGLVRIPFSCQGPWKIFGNPRESLQLAETFRCCRLRMAELLSGCDSPFSCLRNESHPAVFFGKTRENEIHN